MKPTPLLALAGFAALLAALLTAAPASAAPADYFGIRVVDADTGRGVPLVELRTTYKQRYYTDSNGYVAFDEPGLAGKAIWFTISTWGYEEIAGPFGTSGKSLKIRPGKFETVKLKRVNIAERLYRQTGYGIYRDTVLLGKRAPIPEPVINGQVAGSDTVQTAVYKGKMRWFWQDTDRFSFPLGNFSMTGATSALPAKLDPDQGIAFDYFTEQPGGFAKKMAEVDQGGASRPVWADGLMVVKDAAGKERLLGHYAAANADFSVSQVGLLIYDDAADVFKELKRIENFKSTKLYPGGHPFRARDGGVDYYYVSGPDAGVRVKADFESARDPTAYEGFTCLKPDSPTDPDRAEVDRDASGTPKWAWRRGVEPLDGGDVEQLIKAGKMKPGEAPVQLRDAGGKPIAVAGGSVAWNPYLKKWTFLFGQKLGDSVVGEIWFAVADAPEGPWRDAVKVATHAMKDQNMDFYNPMQHPELSRGGGRYVYFEGTFVNTFSGTKTPVPLYDYNNVMYRIDLADPRMKLPDPPPGLSDAKPSPAE